MKNIKLSKLLLMNEKVETVSGNQWKQNRWRKLIII